MRSNLPLSRISFRRQIILLGVVAVVLLLAVLFATFAALRYTKSAVLRDEREHIVETTNSLVREYLDETAGKNLNGQPTALETPDTEKSYVALANLSRSVLENVDGVEGGFYSSSGGFLTGYTLPTRSGEAAQAESGVIPENERPVLLQVAHDAAYSHVSIEQTLATGDDVTLINAIPLQVGNRYVGSAWTMKRLSSIPGTNRFRTYLIAVALGLAAFTCVILTLLVVRGLQSGVRKIQAGLKNLEEDLTSEIPIESDPDEIRTIAGAINGLAVTLRENIESERLIEDRLHHAERLAALGRLVAGVAHEVRNPLATIRLRVQMCQASGNPDVRESCSIALEEIERLNGMVSRLLNFSRPVHLRVEPTNLCKLVEQRLETFSEQAREHEIRFITKLSKQSGLVRLDRSRMAQVFDNVIRNAIEAMADGGTLCVNVTYDSAASEAGREACVEFNDTGQGICADAVNRIFDPFFTTKSSGTGLGLSICHELVEAHGGEIQVASVEGCGTTVRILLPVRDGQPLPGAA